MNFMINSTVRSMSNSNVDARYISPSKEVDIPGAGADLPPEFDDIEDEEMK